MTSFHWTGQLLVSTCISALFRIKNTEKNNEMLLCIGKMQCSLPELVPLTHLGAYPMDLNSQPFRLIETAFYQCMMWTFSSPQSFIIGIIRLPPGLPEVTLLCNVSQSGVKTNTSWLLNKTTRPFCLSETTLQNLRHRFFFRVSLWNKPLFRASPMPPGGSACFLLPSLPG